MTTDVRWLLKESGLTPRQVGAILGASERTVHGWAHGFIPMPAEKQELAVHVRGSVEATGNTGEERKRKLLNSSAGLSIYHQLANESEPKEQRLRYPALTVPQQLGIDD